MTRFRISPQRSQLWAEARSSLHPVRVQTAGLEGVVEAELVDGRPVLTPPTYVELETQQLRSGNGLVDGELQRRLDSGKFPRIRAELKRSTAGNGPGTSLLTGELTLHGVTRTLDVEVTVRQRDERTLEIEGARAIDMRDFGSAPALVPDVQDGPGGPGEGEASGRARRLSNGPRGPRRRVPPVRRIDCRRWHLLSSSAQLLRLSTRFDGHRGVHAACIAAPAMTPDALTARLQELLELEEPGVTARAVTSPSTRERSPST